MVVGVEDVFLAAQSADKHKERRTRQVKICQKSLHDLEVVPGIDEKVRFAATRMDVAGVLLRGELERTHRGRAHRDYTSGLAPGFLNFRSGFSRDQILFGVQVMVFYPLNAHRLEGSEAHVQSNFGGFNAARGQAAQNLSSEMKTCGGSSDGSPVASVYGLITFVVGRTVRARDVRRQRDVADQVDASEEIGHGSEADMALAEFPAGDNFSLKLILLSKKKMLADRDLTAGTNQAFPFVGIVPELTGEQNLDASAKKLAGSRIPRADRLRFKTFAAAIEARRKHPRVVENDEIAGPEKLGEIAKLAIGEGAVSGG